MAILAKLHGSEIMPLSISRILWHILVRVAYASLDGNNKRKKNLVFDVQHRALFVIIKMFFQMP